MMFPNQNAKIEGGGTKCYYTSKVRQNKKIGPETWKITYALVVVNHCQEESTLLPWIGKPRQGKSIN